MKFDSKIYERDIYQDTVYSAWLKHANERDVLEEVLRQKFREWCPKDRISMLELGCGLGSGAHRFFKILKENGVSFDYTGVDPYGDQLERFREWLPKGENAELIRGTFQDFETDRKYNLAVAIHSLYYVDNLQDSLGKLCRMADKSLIIHHGKQGINTIHKRFSQYVKEGPYIISTHEDITRELDELGIDYSLNTYPTNVDVRPCKDSKNPEGRKMIKFFLERSELPEEVIEEVSTFFTTMPDTMNHEMGVILTSPCPSSVK